MYDQSRCLLCVARCHCFYPFNYVFSPAPTLSLSLSLSLCSCFPQGTFVHDGCGGAGPFPAFRRLDCEEEIPKPSWDFYNEYSRACLKNQPTPSSNGGNSPKPSPTRAPTTPQPTRATTPRPTPKPYNPKPYTPSDGGSSPSGPSTNVAQG